MKDQEGRITWPMPEKHRPNGWRVCRVFCDCETFVDSEVNLWEHTEDEDYAAIIQDTSRVIPWLLCYHIPKLEVINGTYRILDKEGYEKKESFYPHKQFFEDLAKIYTYAKLIPELWFHNASYDLTSLLPTAFKELDPDIEYVFNVKEDRDQFLYGCMYSKAYGFFAQFKDTYLYAARSLGLVGQILGLPKGEIPYQMSQVIVTEQTVRYVDWATGIESQVSLSKCLDYCHRDVYITRELFKLNEQDIARKNEVVMYQRSSRSVKATTQGRQSKDLLIWYMQNSYNARFMDLFQRPLKDWDETQSRLKSLTGGYTTTNSNISVFQCPEGWEIACFDCNSMYPSVMIEGVPCGDMVFKKPKDSKNYLEWVLVSCKNVKYKGNMACLKTPPIPITQQTADKAKHPTKFYIYRSLLEFYKENCEGEWTEYKSGWMLITKMVGKFITKLYDLRLQYKKLAKEAASLGLEEDANEYGMIEQSVKVTMNSLYGKLGEKPHLLEKSYFDGLYQERPKDTEYYCVLPGAYIALRGRELLSQKIKAVVDKGFKFLYADTDSVTLAYPKERVEEIIDIFGANFGRLGEWKCEGIFKEFFTPGKKKKYALFDMDNPEHLKIAFGGIKNKEWWESQFINGLIENPEKTANDIRTIFSPNHNILFRNAKTRSILTNEFNQTVICNVHVSFNAQLGYKTGECIKTEDGYKLTIYDRE